MIIQFGDEISPDVNNEVINAYRILKPLYANKAILRAGYTEIVLQYDHEIEFRSLEELIRETLADQTHTSILPKQHEVLVDFNCEENDWDNLITHSGQNKEYLIDLIEERSFKVMMTGFIPGFPYLGTLPEPLHCPRLDNPRTMVPKGSLAIGGEQLGIYPQASPGGWNIIGKVDIELFDMENGALFELGDEVLFKVMHS